MRYVDIYVIIIFMAMPMAICYAKSRVKKIMDNKIVKINSNKRHDFILLTVSLKIELR